MKQHNFDWINIIFLGTCATIPLKDEYNVQCSYRNSPVSCENPYRGTTAKYECKPLYEDLNLQNNPYRRCEDGTWDYSPPSCLPSMRWIKF